MRVWTILTLIALVLAGCSDAPEEEVQEEDGPEVVVDDDTGAIRGVVVDQAIVPVAEVEIRVVVDGETLETLTDDEGQFVFNQVKPGTYFLNASKVQYSSTQVPVTVEAGDDDPPIVRMQIERVLEGTPSMITQQYKGHIACAYRTPGPVRISSTCVNDYTRIDPTGTCQGGCLPMITGVVDQRDFQSSVGPGWQSIVWELSWKPSTGASAESMGHTVSYKDREGASHWYIAEQMEPPFRMQVDVGVTHPTMQTPEQGEQIDPNGQDDLWNMISAGEGVVIEQDIEVFQSNFYNAPSPEGWSLLAGDEDPYS